MKGMLSNSESIRRDKQPVRCTISLILHLKYLGTKWCQSFPLLCFCFMRSHFCSLWQLSWQKETLIHVWIKCQEIYSLKIWLGFLSVLHTLNWEDHDRFAKGIAEVEIANSRNWNIFTEGVNKKCTKPLVKRGSQNANGS